MSNRLLAGRYELIEKIGEGGMAIVYKGKDRLLNRYVAIKILRPEYTKDELFIENFIKESQSAAGLTHPNIVGVYDVGKEGNIHFIVMELIDGKPLSEIIKQKGKLDYKEAISITSQIASALSLAHKNQIIHRDVKPHNILITNQGVAKLADFGIAKAVSAATIVGGSQKVMGSVHYFSPEQARGAYVDERTDIYSLGIVLFEMLTGHVPFDGDNPVSIALMHINDAMPSVCDEVVGVPPQLEKIIGRATEKLQINRYAKVDDMIEELDNIEFITKVMGQKAFSNGIETKEDVVKKYEDIVRKQENENRIHEAERHHSETRVSKSERELEKKIDKTKQNTNRFLIIGIAACLVIGFVVCGFVFGLFGNKSEEFKVPDFVGHTYDEALIMAEEAGLTIERGEDVFSPDQEEGYVCSQLPSSGSMVKVGKVITITVSKGKKDGVMPKIEGYTVEEAVEILASNGFVLGSGTEVNSELDKGVIVSQTVAAGTSAKSGTVVDFEISNGQKPEEAKEIEVPPLLNLTPDEADVLLESLGLEKGDVYYEEVEDALSNTIFGQEPAEGTVVKKGAKVSYYVVKNEEMPEGAGQGSDGEI